MLAELPWGLLPLPSSSRHGPAPLDKLQWQEEKERHRERAQRVGQPQESHGSIWAELHRHLHHPAAKRTPTTSVYRQGHHRAVPLKTGWGNEEHQKLLLPNQSSVPWGRCLGRGEGLIFCGLPCRLHSCHEHCLSSSLGIKKKQNLKPSNPAGLPLMAERNQQSKVHPKPLGSPRWVRDSPDQGQICIITRPRAYLNMNSNQLTS